MNNRLSLTVVTPLLIILQDEAITSLRAEDDSGGFGILPGHADFLTVIDAGVMRWQGEGKTSRYCALRGGVFTVTEGRRIHVACREATLSDDLPSLQAHVAAMQAQRQDQVRGSRSEGTRLHARAIRQLMREFAASGDTLELGLDQQP